MPDRRRVAVVVTPLLGLLAALLLNWSVAAAQAPDPLTLTITAGRAECTAGTLNPVSWEITGGTPPYTLTIDGASVDADAESATVTCGALPEGANEAPGTFTATVTDATGAPATASAAYTIVEPLPAPTGVTRHAVTRVDIVIGWDTVEGAGSQSPPVPDYHGRDDFDSYLFRFRDLDAAATDPYEILEPLTYPIAVLQTARLGAGELSQLSEWQGMVAAIRHPIEQQTPAALNWSPPVQFGTVTEPQNVVVQATHNTLDVSWDEQPYTQSGQVALVGGGLHRGHCCSRITATNGRQHTRFRNLTPDSDYEITISAGDGIDAQRAYRVVAARTVAAPEDWEPPPRGPNNLRATATHDSITVFWDPPFPDAEPGWAVMVFAPNGYRIAIGWPGDPPPSGWTTRGDFVGLEPETTYRVIVAHDGGDGASAEITITTNAAPPPLTMILTAERSECTAGTLNPVTWTITGGAAPYRLTVDGAPVDPDAESATVTCAALPEGASTAPGTITAVVTDATGAPATASAAYTIVPPLPVPETAGATGVHPESLSFRWYTAEPPPGAAALVGFLVRWREVGTAAWTYEAQPPYRSLGFTYAALAYFDGLRDPVAYEAAVAPMRHPLEAETPAALRWTPARQATTLTYAANVTVTTTHDTVTVRWDRQPSATYWYVGVSNADSLAGTRISPADAAAWGDPASGTHEVTLRRLSPDTEYRLRVASGTWREGRPTRFVDVPVRTKPAPAGSTPLPRGPRNLRATSTATSITVTWDPPFAAARQSYEVLLLDQGATRLLQLEGIYAPPWTFTFGGPTGGQFPLPSGTPFRIRVVHDGIVRVETEISIATQPAQASGRGQAPRRLGPDLTCFEYLVGAVICTWPADSPSLR